MVMNRMDENGFALAEPYDSDLMAFECDDDEIRNPFLSPCGRFASNPAEYGFMWSATGGGCTALIKKLDDGGSLWLTDASGLQAPAEDGQGDVLMGRFDSDQCMLAYMSIRDIPLQDTEQPMIDRSQMISPGSL